MKKLLLGICLMITANLISAQTKFRGIVVDKETKQPLNGISIEVNSIGAVTNEKGEFNFTNLHNGKYSFHLSSIGYRNAEFIISTPEKDSYQFEMERLNLFLQPVEVKALRAGDKAPFTKTNLSKKEIQKQNLGQDLPFLLNQTPSVVINADAGNGVGYTGIRIRGTDATRINVTLNGIPYNDAESQGTYFVDLPDFASSVNSIQIQRGVGTSSNGTGAFGGTINLSTNEFNEQPYGELNNAFGSFNTWKNTVKAGSGLIDNHFTIDARLSKISSDGYIDRAKSDLKSFYLSTAYINKKSSLRFNIFSGKEKTYQAWYGVAENLLQTKRTDNPAGTEKNGEPYDNQTDNYTQTHYQLFFNHQCNDNLSFNTAVFLTRGLGYYEEYKAGQALADYGLADIIIGNTTITNTDLVRQLWLDNYFYGNVSSLQYKKDNNQFTIGGGYTRYDGNHYGKITWSQTNIPKDYKYYDLDAKKTDANVYAKYQHKWSNHIETFVDVQYRNVKHTINGFRYNPGLKINQSFNFINPKIGISYTNKDWLLYASYSLGNKEPNRDDFEAGLNQLPKHETLHDFELGLEKQNNQFSWGATAYYMKYKNQLVLTGKINDVGSYTRTNIPNSYRLGLELQGKAKINSWLSASGNLTVSENKILKFTEYIDDYDNGGQKLNNYSKSDISFSPNVIGSAAISITPLKNFDINLLSKYVSRQYLDNTSQKSRSLNPYFIEDVKLSYTLKKLVFKETNFIVQLNNVFNKKYEPNGYTYSYYYGGELATENFYYPMAGTNFMIGVDIKL